MEVETASATTINQTKDSIGRSKRPPRKPSSLADSGMVSASTDFSDRQDICILFALRQRRYTSRKYFAGDSETGSSPVERSRSSSVSKLGKDDISERNRSAILHTTNFLLCLNPVRPARSPRSICSITGNSTRRISMTMTMTRRRSLFTMKRELTEIPFRQARKENYIYP